ALAHLGPTRQRPRHPSIKMPSGQHGLWGHNAASRPPPLPRRRVALPRTAWCGAMSAGRSSGSRIIARLRPSQAPRLDGTGCSVASTGDVLPGYSGATAPELHRTSLNPHSRRTLQRPRRGSLLEPYCEADGQRADRIDVARGDHLHEYLPPGPLDLRDGSAVHVDVHLGGGRRRDEGERRRQDASTSEAGRLVREAQEVAADDLPGLTAIHDP